MAREYIQDIEFTNKKITFIINNGKKFTINNNDFITIPSTDINHRTIIEYNNISLSLIIGPRVISIDTQFIIINGNGWNYEETKGDFLDALRNPSTSFVNNKINEFKEWILNLPDDCYDNVTY
jgi:predicted ATP-grasp superfamily ATP-dependent carboligase